ncbi:hypothetical protein P7H15_14850 [Paenibacillus larvae]|nr:hypothetical protein [Paenibacillus larvae]MDT2293846.1 hypothetical protein [Paenibacillus larvae]
MYERYQAIYLHLKGTSMKAIEGHFESKPNDGEWLSLHVRERWTGSLATAILRCSYSVDEAAAGSLETNRRLFAFPMRSALRQSTTGRLNWIAMRTWERDQPLLFAPRHFAISGSG